MKNTTLKEITKKHPAEKFTTLTDLDKAVIGLDEPSRRIIYCVDKLIEALMELHDWDHEEALDWFGYNIEGAYIGQYTPIYKHHDEEIEWEKEIIDGPEPTTKHLSKTCKTLTCQDLAKLPSGLKSLATKLAMFMGSRKPVTKNNLKETEIESVGKTGN